jgi:hypothetical protein
VQWSLYIPPAVDGNAAPPQTGQQIPDPNLEKEAISGQTSTKWARHQDILTVNRKVTLTLIQSLRVEAI